MIKKGLIGLLLTTASFSAGVYYSEDIKRFTHKDYIAQPGFYKNPYNLKIIIINRNNKVESYLVDIVNKNYKSINENMETGCTCNNTINNKLDFILKFYKFLNLIL